MFNLEHHLRIASVLESFDAKKMADHGCYFGGGTAIVLMRGEYRESVDIDFLVSNPSGYREIRQGITGPLGIQSIVREGCRLATSREIRADQYGIRTAISAGTGVEIKFEIVLEGRVAFALPGKKDVVCGVTTLSPIDLAATQLLANSDRWSDDSVFSRDLIDLAMLHLSRPQLEEAKRKSEAAYGNSIERDLVRAVQRLSERPGRLDDCLAALSFSGLPKAALWSRIKKLRS